MNKLVYGVGVNDLGYRTRVWEELPKNGGRRVSVIHAELNCILKAQREGISIEGATLYVTHSPCEHCASLIIETGITRVVYADEYRSLVGVENLKTAGVVVERMQNERA